MSKEVKAMKIANDVLKQLEKKTDIDYCGLTVSEVTEIIYKEIVKELR